MPKSEKDLSSGLNLGVPELIPTDSNRAIMTDVRDVHCDMDLCDFCLLTSFLAVVAFQTLRRPYSSSN